MLHDVNQHGGEALWVTYLILHVVISLKHGEIANGIGLHDGGAVLEVILSAAEFKVAALLQLLRQRQEGLVLQTVRHLAADITVAQRFARRDEVRLYRLVAAPHYFTERRALRPVQALDGEIQHGHHDAARRRAYLRELPPVKENVPDRQPRPRQERHGEVCTDGRRDDHLDALHALPTQEFLDLPHLVRLDRVGLTGVVHCGRRHDAEEAICKLRGHRIAAFARHAHGVEKQHGGSGFITKRFEQYKITFSV